MTLRLSLATFCRPDNSFAFDFLQHDVHIRHRTDYDKQKAVVVVIAYAPLIRETNVREHGECISKGLGNLCSSAVYNQGQLTLIFNTISCGLQSKASNNRVNTAGTYNRLLEKANENVANLRKHKFLQKMTSRNTS